MDMNTSSVTGNVYEGGSQSFSAPSESGSADQFEMFLKMLTTQIKNQDPLNPMNSTDFAVQLATFSGVEQQVQTNLLLTQLLQNINGGELGQFSNWIGREVRTTSPVWFDQTPLTLEIEGTADAETAFLVTLDDQGNEVLRQSTGAISGEVSWHGEDSSGNMLATGFYRFRLEEMKDGRSLAPRDVAAYSRITGVDLSRNGPELILLGGGSVRVDTVTALRE